MEEDLLKLDALFDSIIEEIVHPELAGTFKNPFVGIKENRISELSEAVTVIMVTISEDSMSAYATVMSGAVSHKPFTAEDILRVASTNGVFYGIDEAAVRDMAEKQLINTEVLIASGMPPVKGSDGRIELKYDVSEGKEIPNIPPDEEIANIIAPHAGRDGKDVRGRVLPAEPGKNPDFVIGEGLYKKNHRVYAKYHGTLAMRAGKYCVVDEMVIHGNVDQTSGIVGYGGSIVIYGNVTGKAVIRAGRSVKVNGIVANSVIEAEDNIEILSRAVESALSARSGDIIGEEFNDCTVVAGGGLTASAILNSIVKCVTHIECTTDMGRITGGEVYCAGSINCLTVGAREHTETHITIGDHTEFTLEEKHLASKIKKLDSEIAKINDQVNQIREKEREGTATLEDKSFLEAAIRIRTQKAGEKGPIMEQIKQIQNIIAESKKAQLSAKTVIYGGAILKVCGFTQILNTDRQRAVVRATNSAIVIT